MAMRYPQGVDVVAAVVVTTAAFAYAPRKNRTVLQVAASVAILAIAIVAVIIRTHQLTS